MERRGLTLEHFSLEVVLNRPAIFFFFADFANRNYSFTKITRSSESDGRIDVTDMFRLP